MNSYVYSRGFTLLELMVVLVLVGIAMAIGIPSISQLVANQRVKSASFELITSAMYARGEAQKRGNAISIVPATGGDLEQGWCVVFGVSTVCDPNNPTTDEMRIQLPFPSVDYLWKTTAGPIVFNRAGRLEDRVQITVQDALGGALPRCITIDTSGSATAKVGGC